MSDTAVIAEIRYGQHAGLYNVTRLAKSQGGLLRLMLPLVAAPERIPGETMPIASLQVAGYEARSRARGRVTWEFWDHHNLGLTNEADWGPTHERDIVWLEMERVQ